MCSVCPLPVHLDPDHAISETKSRGATILTVMAVLVFAMRIAIAMNLAIAVAMVISIWMAMAIVMMLVIYVVCESRAALAS